MIAGKNLIAGRWSADGGAQFTSTNPRTRQPIQWQYTDASADEIDQAVTAAVAAFTITRDLPTSARAAFLEQIAVEIEALGDELLEIADTETGLGLPRLRGERARTINQVRAFAVLVREGSFVDAIIDRALPDRTPAPRPDIRRMSFPIGPTAIFTPNNFPLAFGVAGGDTISALAAGCPVIVKGHPSYPATCELIAGAVSRAVESSGLPAGTFSFLQGSAIAVGGALVVHPDLCAVAFTGSYRGGRAIMDAAAARVQPIPVFAEMGSVNPIVLLPGAIAASPDALADGLVTSVTGSGGQLCTKPGLVFMLRENADFIETVSAKMGERAASILLNESVENGLRSAVGATQAHSAVTLKAGGAVVESDGYSFANTVMVTSASAFAADAALHREHFGPVVLFVLCESPDELMTTLARLEGNLTATVHATAGELEGTRALFDLLREKAGRLILNGFPTGVEVVAAMVHGGPFPATSAAGTTSVGMTAIRRFLRPVALQNMPDALLPDALKDANPLGIWRLVDNVVTRDSG
ncbi:MAG: aldehyde dehydrogenase (NADP(+)) [Chloroflexota bacterium]|nr:aldehyde dehydrogenase (NADP(+)) [Chloroflexota bacterium]